MTENVLGMTGLVQDYSGYKMKAGEGNDGGLLGEPREGNHEGCIYGLWGLVLDLGCVWLELC